MLPYVAIFVFIKKWLVHQQNNVYPHFPLKQNHLSNSICHPLQMNQPMATMQVAKSSSLHYKSGQTYW